MDDENSAGLAAYVDAALTLVDLPVEPELRPRVVMHFDIAAALARTLLAFPLGDEAEPAPVYRPAAVRVP
ncbi:DUF4089 domain-containing protein [Ancylobacter lacus]|uniref:DUF4089 domain-containing protein n=1 Tax=Ancylobacter lacus TaxID=2579970 RepID=UPI001BD08821|nr:DUF4089 domain-containing protein [Ancylobacter lacus]MBS7539326.1 DUF4089 domain-containing protein [Ancylobacter lacus]